ncbi:Lysophospholipase 3 [Yarrowia sp. C11]|nr:Lysophospholipase 3 [Yarrowia sp. E02]KAG5371677.1 Lysophospholipase 3 [Yarrowia sp. C11]
MKVSLFYAASLCSAVLASYTPVKGECPSGPLLRQKPQGLQADEAEYISSRQNKTKPALAAFLKNQNISDFDVDDFLERASPKLAIAAAGGGLRATYTGMGTLQALDDRTENSTLAGYLQAVDYMSGLSGGSWLVGYLAINDYPDFEVLYRAFDGIFNLPGSMGTLGMLAKVFIDTLQKLKAGYQTSVTDQWGRLIYFLLGNAGLLKEDFNWSDIRNLTSFTSHEMPFPIILGTTTFPGTSQDAAFIGFNNSIVEMTPYEFGTWDKNLREFVDIKYLGTEMEDGTPVDQCTTNYDNSGFLMGISSNVFNLGSLGVFGVDGIFGILVEDLMKLLEVINSASYRLGVISPNPFYKRDDLPTNQTISRGLLVCDGGYDLETIPLLPFLQPEREVDVIIAQDPSLDSPEGWPTGECIRNSAAKSNWEFGEGVFPEIPDNLTFIDKDLNKKPVFFGCDVSKLKKYDGTDRYSPVIVYVPSTNITYGSNFSTGKLIYSKEEMFGTVNNAYNVMTRTNLTQDENWGKCLGCVSILRETQRLNETVDDCQSCFDEYCYN